MCVANVRQCGSKDHTAERSTRGRMAVEVGHLARNLQRERGGESAGGDIVKRSREQSPRQLPLPLGRRGARHRYSPAASRDVTYRYVTVILTGRQ